VNDNESQTPLNYRSLAGKYLFVPELDETLDALDNEASTFVRDFGHQFATVTKAISATDTATESRSAAW